MRIKIDENLAIVAARANREPAEVANILINEMMNAGLVKGENEDCGLSVKEYVDGGTPLGTIVDIIKKTGIERVNDTTYDAFLECIVMGDGDCPECGGEMFLTDSVGHEVSNGYDTAPSWVVDWELFACCVCGHEIKHNYTNNH